MNQNNMKKILDMLNILNEDFLSLPDEMLLDINPRDNESLDKGLNFIKEFNDNLSQFTTVSNKIESQIKKYFGINPEEEDLEKEVAKDNQSKRIIKELDESVPHTLDEIFKYKRPYGFVLLDSAYKGLKTWKNLYIQVLKELKNYEPQRFSKLPEEKRFISNRGNPLFSRKKDGLRVAERLDSDFYVEVNLSANSIKDSIIGLLSYFDINSKEMRIYLREDRDA
jgi:hypothetical protein